MTWRPPPRPDWVRAVNAGDVPPIAEVARLPLDRDQLLAEARADLGLDGQGIDGFGDGAFLEPLDVLLPALETEAELNVLGRWLTRRFLLRLLEVRAQMVSYLRTDPGVRDEVITEPVFVTGAPRTGTTILHALLAQDAVARVPEGWELLRP
ncbi:MAG TPA: sulfotransferase, partial [Acidimicrobiia bacterium]|nr:sulfotransferase [Acidimicrobiia bacterium]